MPRPGRKGMAMRGISGMAPIGAPARRARTREGHGFPGAAAELASAAVLPASPAALLAVQQDHAAPGDHPADRQARQTLAELDGLQLDLLRGGADAARLQRLAALADSAHPIADPALRQAAQAIALRARVERARWRRAARPSASPA
jgi:hypothetical protein